MAKREKKMEVNKWMQFSSRSWPWLNVIEAQKWLDFFIVFSSFCCYQSERVYSNKFSSMVKLDSSINKTKLTLSLTSHMNDMPENRAILRIVIFKQWEQSMGKWSFQTSFHWVKIACAHLFMHLIMRFHWDYDSNFL